MIFSLSRVSSDVLLLRAAEVYTVAVVVHSIDHTRRGIADYGFDLYVLGSMGLPMQVWLVAVVVVQARIAPLAAIAVGTTSAISFVLIHWLPERMLFSDSYLTDGAVDGLSQAVVAFLVAASALLAIAGYVLIRRDASAATVTWPSLRELRGTMTSPIVLLMLLGNVAVYAVQLVDRFMA